MVESLEQRKSRLAVFARDAIAAKSDYQLEAEAVVARTARLRAERLEREAVITLPGPRTNIGSRPGVVSRLSKASKTGGRLKAV